MPISKEKQKLYPKNWKALSEWVRIRAGNQCEICDAKNKESHPVTKSKVVLTVHHCDFSPKNNEEYNLIALCQRCHNRLDKRYRARNRKLKRRKVVTNDNSDNGLFV